jgi:hypothetical protein
MRKREAKCGIYDVVDVMHVIVCKEWDQDRGKGARLKANSLLTGSRQGSRVQEFIGS